MKELRINVPYRVIAAFGYPIRDNGNSEVIYYCPYCNDRHGTPDKKGKLYVNVNSLKYHCFRCGASGQIDRKGKVDSSKIYEEDKDQDLEDTIHQINEVLEGEDNFDLKIPINKVFENSEATSYLVKRGFSEDKLEYYDIRVGNIDQEFGRVIIPNQVIKLVYTDFYSARTYLGQVPKYHNPRKSKNSVVFNLHRIKEGSPIILVEGALTAIAAGYHAVASLGKDLSREQASMILKKNPSIIYVNYDYGAEAFTEKACRILKSISPDTKIMKTYMPDERDAADLTHDEYYQCLKNSVEYNPLKEDINKLLELT